MASVNRMEGRGEPAEPSFDFDRALATVCRAVTFTFGCVLLAVAVYFAIEVYSMVVEIVRDPAEVRPRIDSLSETIHADKMAWQPPTFPAMAQGAGPQDPPRMEAGQPPPPIEFGRAVTLSLYAMLLLILSRIPLSLIYAGATLMTRCFAGPAR